MENNIEISLYIIYLYIFFIYSKVTFAKLCLLSLSFNIFLLSHFLCAIWTHPPGKYSAIISDHSGSSCAASNNLTNGISWVSTSTAHPSLWNEVELPPALMLSSLFLNPLFTARGLLRMFLQLMIDKVSGSSKQWLIV
jgi:hypothetical protein